MPPRVRQNQMMVDGGMVAPARRTTTTPTPTFDPTVSIDPLEVAPTRVPTAVPTPPPIETPTPPPTPTPTVDPNTARLIAAQEEANRLARQEAEAARMQAAAAKEQNRVAARDLLNNWLSTFFDPNSQEYAQAKSFVEQQIAADATTDAVQLNIRTQQFYKTRFKGNEARRAAGLSEYTPAEYLQAENAYSEALRRFGLDRLATRETFSNLIGGLVSPDELASRVTTVYDRIQNADAPLRAELQRLKTAANLTDQDLAESLLLGKEGAASLQRKIAQAEIRAEATTRGLTSRLGDVELERRGITRAQAAAGFEQVATELRPLERLSQIYERQAPTPTTELQTELESEALLGQTSQRRRRLIQQEAAAFAGSAGTTPTLASRARAGQF